MEVSADAFVSAFIVVGLMCFCYLLFKGSSIQKLAAFLVDRMALVIVGICLLVLIFSFVE